MLLETNSPVPGSSIMDSPTLARVERAIQRQEGKSILCCQPNQLPGHAIRKGLLWQQRDRLFSRWKERYFILTRDYLHCFRKSTENGPDKISDMGPFIFKIKLVDVDRVEWINKKNYSAVVLDLGRGGRVLLRCQQGLEDWFDMLEENTEASKERRRALRYSHDERGGSENDHNVNSIRSNVEEWLLARKDIAQLERDQVSDSVPDVFNADAASWRNSVATASCSGDDDEDGWLRGHRKRYSLLNDMDVNSVDTPPSSLRGPRATPTPCRLNSDVFFLPGLGAARQRSSIADATVHRFSDKVSCYTRLAGDSAPAAKSTNLVGSFRVPNMLQTTRGTANRYSLVDETQSLKVIYSTYNNKQTSLAS